MSHPPGTEVCQGNFAASVKEILPIYECGALATVARFGPNSHDSAQGSRHQALDRRSVCGVIRFTQAGSLEVLVPQPLDSKGESLRHQGVLNPHPQKVADPLFLRGEFFDPRDLVQVKYEMLRRVRVEGASITEVTQAFGFSRPVFYQAQALYHRAGLPGLIPQRTGPRQAHKLSDLVVDFLLQHRLRDPLLRAPALSELVREHFGLVVHPRSIERALERRRKKVPR
jgi:transposase